jgi:glycosyltransferase involved in cell wall biosynthesis
MPVVVSVGGAEVVSIPDIGYGALRTAWGRWMTATVLQRATFVTAGAQYTLHKARRIVPHRSIEHFRCIPFPINVAAYASGAERSDGLHVLHAASLIPVKDQGNLIRAFRRVVDVVPNARLTIAGEDPFGCRADLEALAAQLGIGDSIAFAGHRRHADMAALYHSTDLFVLSSRHESQGMVVCEAAAAGVPTVGTPVGVVPDFAPDAAVSVRPGDPVALADGIVALLTDSDRRKRLGQQARLRAERVYDAPVVRDAFIGLYHDAIERHRR